MAADLLAEFKINIYELLDAPDAVQIISGKENHAKLLYRVPRPIRSKQFSLDKHAIIDFRCMGRQDVLPNSIHPDTGWPYAWKGDYRFLPMIPAALLGMWEQQMAPATEPAKERTGRTDEQIKAWLAQVDPDMPMNDWVQVGMAIHHETSGQGFELWHEWSAKGSKFKNKRDLQTRWKGFKGDKGVTIATLERMAHQPTPLHFEDISGEEVEEILEPKPLKFPIRMVGDMVQGAPVRWHVKNIVPKAGLGVVFGESGSGKSFLTQDMTFSVARGVDWRGHKVHQTGVLYLASEGQGGMPGRSKGYGRRHKVNMADLPFGFIEGAPSLLTGDWKDLCLSVDHFIAMNGPLGIIVVDTLAQSIPGGDENSSETMSKVIANCRKLHQHTGATVILVHHAGKDTTKGARGHSSLRAACDFEIEVTRGTESREMRVSKQKDGADGLRMAFRLEVVETGSVDEDGEPETTCVVDPTVIEVDRMRVPDKARANERLVIETFQGMLVDGDTEVSTDAVIDAAVAKKTGGTGDQKGNVRMNIRAAVLRCFEKQWLSGDFEKIYVL